MYDNLQLSSEKPGFIIILLDQSGSMEEEYADSTKQAFAASAVNNFIYEVLTACSRGPVIKDRCQLALIGYGNGAASVLLEGLTSKVDKMSITDNVWIEPKAKGDTPMHLALDEAAKLINKRWLPKYPDSFPPIVINITDGRPTYDGKESFSEAESAAKRLTNLKTKDGQVLLFNAHISTDNTNEWLLPKEEPPESTPNMKFLFGISSRIPDTMLPLAETAGLPPDPGVRGFIYNASADALTKLLLFGSTPVSNPGLR